MWCWEGQFGIHTHGNMRADEVVNTRFLLLLILSSPHSLIVHHHKEQQEQVFRTPIPEVKPVH